MRFTPLILTGLFALSANAQSGTTSASAPLNSEQAAIIKCIDACQDGDVSCTSKCIAVPNPSDQDVRLLLTYSPSLHLSSHLTTHSIIDYSSLHHSFPPPTSHLSPTTTNITITGQRNKRLRSRLSQRQRHRIRQRQILRLRARLHRTALLHCHHGRSCLQPHQRRSCHDHHRRHQD